MFETLNARGLELTESDLLKNYLLSLAERLSKSQIEPVLKQWSRITGIVGIAKFPEFLRHHLNSYRPFVRQKQLFKTIKQDIRSLEHVYELLDKLEQNAVWFDALGDSASEFWLDYQYAKEQVRVLNLFNVSQYTPFVLAAKDHFTNPTELVEVLKYCAVVSVRFNGVSHRSTHILEETYNRIALDIRTGTAKTLKHVRQGLGAIYIPDDEFEADFSTLKLRNRGSQNKKLRFFLAKIEKQLSGADIHDETMSATIEHILPEKPAENSWEQFTAEAHDRSYQRLGNYSLLERNLNTSLAANSSFSEKQAVYAQSQYRTSQELIGFHDWTEETIAKRQHDLAKVAKSIWSLPS